MLPIVGQVFTELDAIRELSGATAELVAAGGVCGAEGACWLTISGTKKQEEDAGKIVSQVENQPPFKLLVTLCFAGTVLARGASSCPFRAHPATFFLPGAFFHATYP